MSIKNSVNISLSVNGESFDNVTVPTRQHLADFLRSQGLTGTHLGCEQGACGACTIEMDGKAVRSCLILASQANGSSITTVEGFDDEVMEKVKNNFLKHNAFQCGFCSPGMLMTTKEIISSKKKEDKLIEYLIQECDMSLTRVQNALKKINKLV